MFDDATVHDLVENYDLLSVVEKQVSLEKKGRFFVGPCPICGGVDRFNLTMTTGGWRWHCRNCASGKYFNAIHLMEKMWNCSFAEAVERMGQSTTTLTEEERLAIATERARRAQAELEAAIHAAENKLDELRAAKAWERYHSNLDLHNAAARQLWEYRGVPQFWQDWWKLGYDPSHTFGEYVTPTMTIPIFAPKWDIRSIKHRLLDPGAKMGKYRPEMSGLPPSLWISDPDRPMSGPAFVTEGEIKAMVTAATYDDERLLFAGLPGKTPGTEVLASLADVEPIYLCLDPDVSEKEILRVAEALGTDRVRVIDLPEKIDDLILQYHYRKNWIVWLLNTARKVG